MENIKKKDCTAKLDKPLYDNIRIQLDNILQQVKKRLEKSFDVACKYSQLDSCKTRKSISFRLFESNCVINGVNSVKFQCRNVFQFFSC